MGPETSSAKQSCFGSALSRSTKVFLVTFVTIDKSNPAEQKTKITCTVYPQSNSIKAKTAAAFLRQPLYVVLLFAARKSAEEREVEISVILRNFKE